MIVNLNSWVIDTLLVHCQVCCRYVQIRSLPCIDFMYLWVRQKLVFIFSNKSIEYIYIYIYIYTGGPRRNVPDFRRVFLMLKYTDIPKTPMSKVERLKCGLLAGPRTVPVSWQSYLCYVVECGVILRQFSSRQPQTAYVLPSGWWRSQPCYVSTGHACVMYSAWNPKDNYDMSASVFVVQLNGFMSLTS